MRRAIFLFLFITALFQRGQGLQIGAAIGHGRQSSLSVAMATRSKGHHTTQRIVPIFDEVCETTGVTLTRFMMEVEKLNPELQELAQLFSGIQTACKAISNLVRRSQLPKSSVLGYEGVINVQGEDQKVKLCHENCDPVFYT
jgi:hypothetical protein